MNYLCRTHHLHRMYQAICLAKGCIYADSCLIKRQRRYKRPWPSTKNYYHPNSHILTIPLCLLGHWVFPLVEVFERGYWGSQSIFWSEFLLFAFPLIRKNGKMTIKPLQVVKGTFHISHIQQNPRMITCFLQPLKQCHKALGGKAFNPRQQNVTQEVILWCEFIWRGPPPL